VAVLHGGRQFDMDRVCRVSSHWVAGTTTTVYGPGSSAPSPGRGSSTWPSSTSSPWRPPQAEARARSAVEAYVRDESQGSGEAYVSRAHDPIAAVVARAEGFDLLVLGITRPLDQLLRGL